MDIICKFNGETATRPMQKDESLWDIIEEMVYIFWELSPLERNWKRKAARENFALFEYCGVLHDVFALRGERGMEVFIVAE